MVTQAREEIVPKRKPDVLVIGCLLIGLLAGCSRQALQEEPAPVRPAEQALLDPSQGSLVGQAKQDLAQRLNVELATVELVDFESVVWPDSSFGCPEPGMVYTQALRDGYRISLRVGEREYAYHGGTGRDPFLCENPEPAVEIG
jgi:hypothetical protein